MGDTKSDSTKRHRVYLKSGMGSVAAEDYDEKLHGKALELSDHEYDERQRGVIRGVTVPAGAPGATPAVGTAEPGKVTTTIAGLHTFDPAESPTPTPVTAPPALGVAAPSVGKAVATVDAAPKTDDQKKDVPVAHK